jgi:hypothetical protein
MMIVKGRTLLGITTGIWSDVRQIDHLILCVHGIGQKLGERMEGVNFVHGTLPHVNSADADINVFRRTLKDTFASSTDLNILLNKESVNEPKKPNCRIQVLPVQWRQEVQFGVSKEYTEGERPADERDIGDATDDDGIIEDTGNATLKDITVEGLAPIRSLISDGTPLLHNSDYSIIRYPSLLHPPVSRTYSPSSISRNEHNIHPLSPT